MVGELKSDGEEFDCAVLLDESPAVKWWVRNLERRADSSFWLQTSTDKFYPDFVALLTDGRILGGRVQRRGSLEQRRFQREADCGQPVGGSSKGKCPFVMPKGPDWKAIEQCLG